MSSASHHSAHFPGRSLQLDQLFQEYELAEDRELDDRPELSLRICIQVFASTRAVFYARSEAAGTVGMHQEVIRYSPQWYGDKPRFDTAFVQTNLD